MRLNDWRPRRPTIDGCTYHEALQAVAIEGGGYGASSAAPVARKVLDAWLLGKMPVPAPAQAAAGDPAVAASADADPQAVPPVATEPAR